MAKIRAGGLSNTLKIRRIIGNDGKGLKMLNVFSKFIFLNLKVQHDLSMFTSRFNLPVKISHNDRYRQGDAQNTTNGAHGRYEFASGCFW